MTAPVIPSTLTTPPTTPNRGDRATFAARSFALDEFNRTTRTTEFNTLQTQTYNNALAAYDSAAVATASPSVAPAWVSGATYVLGYPVYSVLTKKVYRRIVAGAGATDPSTDTTNWEVIPPIPLSSPAFHNYGGQLRKLAEALSNPLIQFLGVVFVGDSLTWGRTLSDNAVFDPRDGTLSDPRDNLVSSSFVNEFKRHVGLNYADTATAATSNWAASPSGQAIATYVKTNGLYPKGTPFTFTTSGGSVSNTEVASFACLLGQQWQLSDGNSAGTSWQKISFNFTGTTFNLVFSVVDASKIDYELIVDGVSQGLFGTGVSDGFVDASNQNRRTHTFGFVDNKVIEIKTNRAAYGTGTRTLRVEAVEVPKTIRITNQGINGATTKTYLTYNLLGAFGDGIAVGAEDSFVISQLGTNDRILRSDVAYGTQGYRKHLIAYLDALVALCPDVILMCPPPASNNAMPTYTMSMQSIRSVVVAEGKLRGLDVIDNYAIFPAELGYMFPDGVHPDKEGHKRIASNIIGAIEGA